MRHVHLHIGAHKTASSMIQANLVAHRDQLRESGVHVVTRREILQSAFGDEIYEVAQGRHPETDVSAASAASLAGLLPNNPAKVLISNEDMICHLDVRDFYQNPAGSMRYAVKAFAGFDLTVILYVRSQADYLESIFIQHVHLGRRLKFGQFLERIGDMDFSWLRVVEGLEEGLASGGQLRLRAFEAIRHMGELDFYRDFLGLCGVAGTQRFTIDGKTVKGRTANRSYSQLGIKIAHMVNPHLNPAEKKIFRSFLQENFSTATHSRAVLFSPEQRAEIFARYSESNRRMFDRYDLGVDGQKAGFF